MGVNLTCRQSRAASTILGCFVSKARRKGKITRSASDPSRVCPASAKVAAAACPVFGFAVRKPGPASTNFVTLSVGLDGTPSDPLLWISDLHPIVLRQQNSNLCPPAKEPRSFSMDSESCQKSIIKRKFKISENCSCCDAQLPYLLWNLKNVCKQL